MTTKNNLQKLKLRLYFRLLSLTGYQVLHNSTIFDLMKQFLLKIFISMAHILFIYLNKKYNFPKVTTHVPIESHE